MRSHAIFLLFIPLLSLANDENKSSNLIFSFSESSGYTYFLPKQQVHVGYSAQLVADGHFVGSVITPNKEEFSNNEKLKKIFEDLLEADKKNFEKLSKLKENISQEVGELKSSGVQIGTANIATKPSPSMGKLDWIAYTACAKKIMPFLKQSIVFLYKSKTDSSIVSSYYLTKTLVDELSDSNGVACGQYLGTGLDLQINGHIRNIKVLTAFLKRTGGERKILLQTLVGAFSKKAPASSGNQFAYYFARQFFVAAVTTNPIPAYEVLNQELKSTKETETYTTHSKAITFSGDVVTRYKNIDENYKTGLEFVRNLIK